MVAEAIFAHRYAVALLEEAFCIAGRVETAGRDDFADRNVSDSQEPLHFVESAVEDCLKDRLTGRLTVPQVRQAPGYAKVGGDIGG